MGNINKPTIRFPEFREVWENKCLGDLGIFSGGGTPDTSEVKFWNGDIPWISSSDIMEDSIQEIKISRFITMEAVKKSATKIIPTNSVLMVSRVGIGKFAVSKQPLCTSQDFTNLLPKDDNAFFLGYYFKLKTNRFLRFSQGTSIKGFTGVDIRNMDFQIPTLPEQQKIALFFTAIDQKISQLKHKKNLLEQYRMGVMQKIFSQEIRFKDDNGQEFPKWKKMKFEQIYSFRVTNSFSRDDLNFEEGDVKNIHYGDIHTKFNTLFDITKESVPFINPDISIKKISSDNYCRNSDIVFADASEDLADVGKSIELVNLNDEKVLAGLHTILARPDVTKIASGFGGYLMKSIDVRKQIMKIAQGSKITSISSTRLCDIELNIPYHTEQTKIANFLSSIDDKINHTMKQIDKTEVWKKGLMQQMFV